MARLFPSVWERCVPKEISSLFTKEEALSLFYPLFLFVAKGADTALKAREGYKIPRKSQIALYGVFRASYGHLRKALDAFEAKAKAKEMGKAVSEARSALPHPEVFWLCSFHGDCAEDHRPYQGKIYVDGDWEALLSPYPKALKKARRLIEREEIASLEWVTHKPVWLMTRPNCRHYFEGITLEEATGESAQALLERKGMVTEKGDKDFRTLRHPLSKAWYTRKRVEEMAETYEERSFFHARQSAYSEETDPEYSERMSRLARKEAFMAKQWKEMLQGNPKRG